jgi:hypothetical protein
LADLSASNKLNAETIDLPELSKDSRKFADFVEGQQQIVLASSSVATIPTRREVAVALMNGTYEKYNPADFVGLKFGLYNEIRSESHYPFSFFTVRIEPQKEAQTALLAEALKRVPIKVAVTLQGKQDKEVIHPQEALSLEWETLLERSTLSKQLLALPANNLTPVNVVMSVGFADSDLKFASIPATVLIPHK